MPQTHTHTLINHKIFPTKHFTKTPDKKCAYALLKRIVARTHTREAVGGSIMSFFSSTAFTFTTFGNLNVLLSAKTKHNKPEINTQIYITNNAIFNQRLSPVLSTAAL